MHHGELRDALWPDTHTSRASSRASSASCGARSATPPGAEPCGPCRGSATRLPPPWNEKCREVYADFRDASGSTLAEKLRREEQRPAEHLRSLRWLNGAEHPRCRNRRVFLVTQVGARFVLVCPDQFGELAVRQPTQAAGLLIHEQLHALGLGENPPASEDITRRVLTRCGG